MDMDLKTAINARRLHHQLYPEYLEMENEFPAESEMFLRAAGNQVRCVSWAGSTVQAVAKYPDFMQAYSDPRKGGRPDGV
jgi:gamma-glutamyltranspeptidase